MSIETSSERVISGADIEAKDCVKEAKEELPLFADERHSVLEYLVGLGECNSIDALKFKIRKFYEEYGTDDYISSWIKRIKCRRFLFCPNENKWHVIAVVNTEGLDQVEIAGYFDAARKILFKSSKYVRTTAGERFQEEKCEAEGCIRVLDENFDDEEFREYNLDRIAKYLARSIH